MPRKKAAAAAKPAVEEPVEEKPAVAPVEPEIKLSEDANNPTVISKEVTETAHVEVSGASIPPMSAAQETLYRARQNAQRQSNAEREKNLAEQQQDISNELSLRNAMNRRRIFNGKIVAVEEIGSGENRDIAVIVILGNNIKVIIPFDELFPRNPLLYSTIDITKETPQRVLQRKRQFTERMISGEHPFIITRIENDGDMILALGSRAQAMHMISERAFGGEHPRFQVGDLIEARVSSVSVNSLTVMFEGVDCTIQMANLTRSWVLDLHHKYAVGDPLYARIRGIRNDNGVYRLQLDTIAVELEDAKERYRIISDGARTRAIITAVFRTQTREGGAAGSPRIFAWIPNYELPARVVRLDSNTFGHAVSAGNEVIVRVINHAEDGYLICEAMYDYGNNSIFSQGRYR